MKKFKLYQSNDNLAEVNGLFQDNSEELFTHKNVETFRILLLQVFWIKTLPLHIDQIELNYYEVSKLTKKRTLFLKKKVPFHGN